MIADCSYIVWKILTCNDLHTCTFTPTVLTAELPVTSLFTNRKKLKAAQNNIFFYIYNCSKALSVQPVTTSGFPWSGRHMGQLYQAGRHWRGKLLCVLCKVEAGIDEARD